MTTGPIQHLIGETPRSEMPKSPYLMNGVSIVVVCLNEEAVISKCIDSLLTQTHKATPFEIIVVDGNSTDKTLSIAKTYSIRYPILSVVVEHKKGTAAARNRGITEAQYSLVAFIDADCIAPSQWLSKLVTTYIEEKSLDPDVIAVGGRNVSPPDASSFVRGIEISLDSYIGSFSSTQGRQFRSRQRVESIATLNALYDKSNLLKIGLFDESLGSEGEDADLNFRLRERGYELVFLPESVVYHFLRSSPKLWFKNMFRYGKARARLLKRHKSMRSPRYLLPPLFISVMATVMLSPMCPVFLFPLSYFPLIFLYSLIKSYRQSSWQLSGHVFSAYVMEHFGYGAGMIYGLLSKQVR